MDRIEHGHTKRTSCSWGNPGIGHVSFHPPINVLYQFFRVILCLSSFFSNLQTMVLNEYITQNVTCDTTHAVNTSSNQTDGNQLTVFQLQLKRWTCGIVPLTLSLICCVFMLGSIFLVKPRIPLYKHPSGIRLTVYLALCDLIYTLQMYSFKISALATKECVPRGFCTFIGMW